MSIKINGGFAVVHGNPWTETSDQTARVLGVGREDGGSGEKGEGVGGQILIFRRVSMESPSKHRLQAI